jgi:hypothetical protein
MNRNLLIIMDDVSVEMLMELVWNVKSSFKAISTSLNSQDLKELGTN